MQLKKQALKTFNSYKQRFKAKIKRLEKKGIDVSQYIDTSIPSKDSFSSRKEYNAWKKKVDQFTSRNNADFKVFNVKREDGYSYPILGIEKRKLREYTKEAIKHAKNKQQHYLSLPVLDLNGNVISSVKEQQEMFKDHERGFVKVPRMIDEKGIPSRHSFLKRIETMQERSKEDYFEQRNEQMRENWIRLARIAYGDLADDVVNAINTLSHDEFLDMYYMFREFSFELYDSNLGYLGGKEYNESINELTNIVRRFKQGQIDNDLNSF